LQNRDVFFGFCGFGLFAWGGGLLFALASWFFCGSRVGARDDIVGARDDIVGGFFICGSRVGARDDIVLARGDICLARDDRVVFARYDIVFARDDRVLVTLRDDVGFVC
jgi:hypothetical protein